MRNLTGWIALFALLAAPALAEDAVHDEAPTGQIEAPKAEAKPLAAGDIVRAQFTSFVSEREPTDDVSQLSNDHGQVAFFTELLDFEGQTVTHVWERDGEVMAEVPFAVGGPRWRTHSTKNLEPSWTGTWTVKVVDEAGTVRLIERFSYIEASAPAEPVAQVEEAETPAAIPAD